MKYAKKFETQAAYNTWRSGSSFVTPSVSFIDSSKEVIFDKLINNNGHDYVNLGLPSGTLWATMNLGATVSSDLGSRFAWGELDPKSSYTWNNYYFGTQNNITKYTSSDEKYTLEPEDDAAVDMWGGDWHIPYPEQWQELFQYTNHTSMYDSADEVNGVYGKIFTSTVDSTRSIFIPFSGWMDDQAVIYPGEIAYWANEGEDNDACQTYFDGDGGFSTWYKDRYYGCPIRPVIGIVSLSLGPELPAR